MKRYGILVGLWLVVAMGMTAAVQAATYNQHYFNCKNCHKANFSPSAMAEKNICLQCHAEGKGSAGLSLNPPPELDGLTNRLRAVGDASNHFLRNPTPGKQISHIWGVTNNVVDGTATLVQEPARTDYAGFYSRYNASTGKVTCSRCHNPHGEAEVDQIINATGLPGSDGIWDSADANRLLLQRDSQSPTGTSPLTAEKLCRACHVPFNIPNTNHATISHPILADYANFQSGHTTTYKTPAEIAAIAANSKVKLVEVEKSGTLGVGCTSCHGIHDVDSDSTTQDGAANRSQLATNWPGAQSDGHLLRSDGPTRKSSPDIRDKSAGSTAQLRSNLCQSCHKYQLHAKTGSTNAIGCLDCHGGHSYNGGNASAYVLKNQTPDAVPIRLNRASAGTAQVTFNQFTTIGSDRTRWSDNTLGTANGFCEKCHGDVEALTGASTKHAVGTLDLCKSCHLHGDATYSFANDANAATCGQCHGFPPYLSVRGDVGNDPDGTGPNPPLGTLGGYAYNYVDGGKTYNYSSNSGAYKLEATTAHKAHAGHDLTGDVGNWYFVGTTGLDNCKVCHGPDAGSTAGNHRVENGTTFRDLPFDGIAKTGGLVPAYKTANPNIWTCSNTYCHSSGGPRTGNGPTRNYSLTVMTPAWDTANSGGDNKIIGDPNRCGFCHGNDVTDMGTRQNSTPHIKHLNKGFSCNVCHATVAASATALVAGATDGKNGGKHVSGTIEVAYPTSGNALFTALGASSNGVNWEAPGGTCSVYCHDPSNTGRTADWDDPAGVTCGTCHGITAATLTTGAHAIHINSSKADVSCNACHGTNAISGTHSGHVDGQVTKLSAAASCDACHGIDAGDSTPVWTNPSSTTCSSCHSGATTTSYTKRGGATVTAPAKALAATVGHNRPTASGAYPVTGKPAGNKQCSACHLTTIGTGHVDGLGNGDLLVGGFSCESCHTAAGSRSAEATVRVKTHDNRDPAYTLQKRADFTKTCLACHDPHGTQNGAMLERVRTAQNAKDASGNFGGDVTFTAMTGSDSFDEDDGTGNLDDICATCHTTTLHNARAVAGTHQQGTNCTTVCHGHNSDKGGFMPSGGTACNDCHGNPPTLADNRPAGKAGVHAAHVKVAGHSESEDKFDCDVCHPGAASFTLGHADGSVALAAGITNGTCSTACHYSGNDGAGPNVDDGYWTDTDGLNCSSCHYWGNPPTRAGNVVSGNREALSDTHNKHFDANKACITCHPDNGAELLYPNRAHIDDHEAWTLNNTNDGTVLTDRANATQDEVNVIVTSWVDGTDTCNNAACHNPSGITKSATWGTPNSQNCDFCHSSTNPDAGKGTPGSHGAHMAATTNFGLTVACTSCHPNNAGNNGHLNGSVALNGFTYSTSLTDYTSSTFGRCTTTTCHNNGRGTAVQTPVWGTVSADCTICHNNGSGQAYPNNGRHADHVPNTNYVSSCGSCHANATATTITAATHINNTRNTGASITSFTTPTCVNACHLVDATGNWGDSAELDCLECHTSGKTAGGTYPNTGLHTGTLTVSANTHDNSFKVTKNEGTPTGTCLTCHPGINLAGGLPATHIAGGAPAPADATIPATVGYLAGSPATCGPNGALVNCHDDKGAWKRRWSTTATATNGTQCGNCHGNFDLTWVTGVGQRHSSDAQLHGSHNGVDDCYTCHTYKAGDTTYYNIANAPVGQHRDGNIQLNNQMSFNDDGATVHCTGCHTTPLGLADGQYSFQDTYNGDGADGGLNRWGRTLQNGPSANCNSCHVTNGFTHADANESAAVHTYHTGSPLTPGCGACHPADSGPGGALHQNGTVNFGGTYLTTALNYTSAFSNTNCSTANGCHNSDNNSWVNDSLATCADCHAATGKVLYTGSGLSGYPPTSNEHAIHIANNAYVGATASTDCDDCHGAGASAPDHLAAHNDGFLTMANKVSSYTTADGTCTNTCHLTADGRDWTSNTTLICVDCHQFGSSYIGEATKPARAIPNGLHKALNATAHDDNFGAGGTCTSCHTSINLTTPATHVNGLTTDPNTAYGLFVNYRTANGDCYATCHADGGDWRRKWLNVTDAKPQETDLATAAVCGNCHGSFAQGWKFVNEANTSTTDHTDPDADNSGDQLNTAGHQICSACHGWGVAGYDSGNKHQNNSLTMNSDLGYTDGTGGCATNCHHGLTLTMKTNSGFTTETAGYGGVGCGGCHDDGALPPNSGAHVAHGADSDTDYTECEACHGTNNGGSWATGSGGAHNNGTVNFVAAITYSNGGTPGTNAAAANDTCTTSVCHSAAGNPATWGTPASVGCNACHYYEASPSGTNNAANANALSISHNAHFNKGKVCTDCHGTLPVNRTHIAAKAGTDGQVITLKANAAQNDADPVAKSGMTWDDNLNTCSGAGIGNGCHNTKDTPAWGTTGIGCTACHTAGGAAQADPSSGLHNMTANNVQPHNGTLRTGCTECHATMANDPASHIDGSWLADGPTNQTVGGQPRFLTFPGRTGTVYTEGAVNGGTCFDNGTTGLDYNAGAGCHRDNGVWKRLWSTNANVDINANPNPGQLVCDVCHGQYQSLNGSSAGWREGSVHYRSGADGAAENKGVSHNRLTGTVNACQDCHAYASAGGNHENGILNFDGLGTNNPDTFTLTMGSSGWYCATCHNAASAETATDTASHTFPDSTAITTRAYVAGTSYPEGGCTGCHGNNGTGGFWPDGSTGHAANTAGAHPEHVLEIAKKLYATGSPTVAQQNATCNYCHPGNTHGGADGALPADVSRTDLDNNGLVDGSDPEQGTYMKRIISPFANDTTGLWRRTPGTCSNVACHARAPFTPHWYGDNVVPGAITDLASVADTEPGSVKLTWTAPGDDGTLDGTPYRYDVRYSTSPITAGNFDAASQGPAPVATRKGRTQTVVVKGLTPGATYYFAVKAADERYPNAAAWSAISNLPPGVAAAVDGATYGKPVFYGVNAVSSNDYSLDLAPNPDTNSVNVSWDAARDHSHSLTTPLNYVVLWSTYSLRTHFANNGPMPAVIGTDSCFDKTDTPLLPVTCGSTVPLSNEYRIKSAQTTALNYDVKNLPVGTVYNFLVRAKDAAGNVDTNRAELSAMARTTASMPRTLVTYYTSAAITGSTPNFSGALGSAYPGTAPGNISTASGNSYTWSPTTTYTEKKTVYGLNFQLKIYNGNSSAVGLTYQLGYLNGSTFTAIKNKAGTDIAAKNYTMPRRTTRVIKFPLNDYVGTIPSGCKPAFRLTTAGSLTIYYGSTANKGGILLFNQQGYNDLPTGLGTLAQTDVPSTFIGGNLKRLTWSAANPTPNTVDLAQAVHYDVFASLDGGATWPYTVGRNLTTASVDWDPVGDGITGNQTNVKFKVLAGDGYRDGNLYSKLDADQLNHVEAVSTAFTVNNTVDAWAPAAIGSAAGTADDLKAETRPKQGGVALSWKAVGNDGFNHGTRATQYDIRYDTRQIVESGGNGTTSVNFADIPLTPTATSGKPANVPKPDFTGAVESYEVLGLNPGIPYYFAMKVGDDAGNWSPLSNVASTNSGPKCGICHATPPNETATAGNHMAHGYTMNDCANCHGTAAATFTTDHQDGEIRLGWKTASPVLGVIDGSNRITYTQGATTIYTDAKGGGFNAVAGDINEIDNGTCSGFTGTNTGGCHGPASPNWVEGVPLACSACHGTTGRTTDAYGRNFDATLDNGMVVPDEIKASPPVDNHGGSTGIYVGAHLKHLNSSFRLAKGDNCMLCHKDYVHADGNVDVNYDKSVTGEATVDWSSVTRTCSGTSVDNCHGSNTPSWDSAATVACVSCHGFNGVNPAHISDGGSARACTWCHPAGHPQGTVQDTTSIMIPNNPLVGIAYRSGGIHLLKTINGRTRTTEAEICWACHDAQGTKITEWATNNDALTGATNYNYGDLFNDVNFTTATSNWLGSGTGAYWRSGTGIFQTLKKGKIQSTHSTNSSGTSAVAYDATNSRYNETLDAVADIRCSNCHDVHNMNKAPDDSATGTPYLRGTWMGNPYSEDGPPLSGTTYLAVAANGNSGFGAVPRGGTGYRQLGGYYIDQNNVAPGTASRTANAAIDDYPTAGWTQQNSAGLCALCHGEDVDNMDQTTGENLWLGTNGHSNSAIGGTFAYTANIFDQNSGTSSLSGRPLPVTVTGLSTSSAVPDMAYQAQGSNTCTRGYGYRGCSTSNTAAYTPLTSATYAHLAYDWGATVDTGTTDLMYHQFSCSKCHNPHASRLPKLLITNCLDIQHNTWDDNKSQQATFTSTALTNVDRFGGTGERSAYYASAQNCHRYSERRKDAGQSNPGGWNKVSVWTTANQ